MGGLYFSNGVQSLHTPRMGKVVYYATKGRIIDALKKHFLRVDCPLEAPEKSSFGDIDIVVQAPINVTTVSEKDLYDLFLKVLKPERLETDIQNSKSQGGLMFHAAIPWPDDVPEKPYEPLKPEERNEKLYIQLDLRVCNTIQSLWWNLFKHAHGDIWSIIGSTIRRYGLTVDEEALYIRIPEIETFDRKRARVALTSEPDEILDFLGLDSKVYWSGPFQTLEGVFEYVAQCRMFFVRPGDGGRDWANLKSNDRKRVDSRPAYRRWVNEFIPSCRDSGRFNELRISAEEVKKEALARFSAQDQYDQRLREFRLEKQREKIWNTMIKKIEPPAEFADNVMYPGCAIKALKRTILEGSEKHYDGEVNLKTEDGYYNEAKVRSFLEEHGEEIGRRAYAEQQAAYHAKKEKQAKTE